MPVRFPRRSAGRVALLLSAALAALIAAPVAPLAAQRVLGAGDDATITPRGKIRLDITSRWTTADQRYGQNNALEPLGSDFTLDSAGATQFPVLLPLQASIRDLTGQSNLGITLGKTVLQVTSRITAVPITIDAGLTSRLSFGFTVPIIKTHNSVFFNANPARNEGNIAFNPALTDATTLNADTAFANQVVRSATAAQAYCAGTGAADPLCTTNAGAAAAAITFGQGLGQLYGVSPLVPVTGSDVQTAIDTRAASYRALLNQFAAADASIPAVTGTGVIGSVGPMTRDDFQFFLDNAAYGVQSAPLATIDRLSLGDVDLHAKFALYDGVGTEGRFTPSGIKGRAAVGASLRAPTGHVDSPDNFLDIGTGSHAWGVGVQGYGDLLMGAHFWTSFVARYMVSMSNDQDVRITDTPAEVFAAFYRRATVQRKLGAVLELEASPRWVVNDFFSLSATYQYRHKAADTYTGETFTAGPDAATGQTTITVNPVTLSTATEATEQRVGGGIAFSNVAAYQAGKAKFPFEVTYQHFQTVSGRGGNVPRVYGDQIQFRLYARLFGQ